MKRFPFFQVMMKPDDEGAGGDNDGTLIDATRDMPDIEALERGQGQPVEAEKTAAAEREANGRFKAKEGAEPAAKAEEGKEPAEGDEDEEDYIELPGEKEGEEPQRYKVSDVFAGYQKARQLEADIAAGKVGAKASAEMTPDAEKATEDLIRQMSEYSKANEIFAAMQQVREPSMDLLNPESEHYDPALYAQQKQQAAQVAKQITAAKAEIERVGNERSQLQQKLDAARFQREQSKLNEFWPELMADKSVQTEVMTKAEKAYGFKAEDFNGIVDHRHYKVLKDALAYRAAQEKTEAVVKVVRAKPKLVKGAARSSVNPKDAKRADAMDRLTKTGSIDDAADALEGFLH